MTREWETLLPVLVHIQTNPGEDLSLAALGSKAGLSPFHFQRTFKSLVGESPKGYTQRLRLERAAFRLVVQEATVLDIALECGFQNDETFTRAFRRKYRTFPQTYRQWVRDQATVGSEAESALLEAPFGTSATKVVTLRPMHVAFVRHVGP